VNIVEKIAKLFTDTKSFNQTHQLKICYTVAALLFLHKSNLKLPLELWLSSLMNRF
jgi:hypothetical protein